jgi:PleD family two-component response regulator
MLPVLPLAQKLSTKVLVVNNQDSNSNALIRILNSLGIKEVFKASDYQDFKSCYHSFLPDLLILDLDVSCGSAESIIEWLRSDPQGRLIPIIVSTSMQNEGINRSLKKGANDYIQSPFVAAQVSVRISNLMQLSNHDFSPNVQLFDKRLQMGIEALQSETLQRNQAEQALHFQANHEYHSGLPNRIFLQKVLERCLKNELTTPSKTKTLVIFHLHHFSEINNTLGHSRADEILVEMALRFSTLCQNYTEV